MGHPYTSFKPKLARAGEPTDTSQVSCCVLSGPSIASEFDDGLKTGLLADHEGSVEASCASATKDFLHVMLFHMHAFLVEHVGLRAGALTRRKLLNGRAAKPDQPLARSDWRSWLSPQSTWGVNE